MSRKRISLFILSLILVFQTACVERGAGLKVPKAKDGREFIIIATGGTAGAYYPLGGALANIYNHIDGLIANSQATGASAENIGLVAGNEAEIGFVQNDVAYYAYNGIEIFEKKEPITNIRGMSVLYPEMIQIIATESSGIKSVEDLRGKRIAVGAPGSGVEVNVRQILKVHGMTYDDIKPDFLSFSEAADQLKNKQIDGAFLTAALPTSGVTEVTQTAKINVIPIAEDKIQKLQEEYPFYTGTVVPKGTYKGNDEDVPGVAVMAMLIAPAELDEELAYQLTKNLYERKDIIEKSHGRGKDITLEGALKGMPIEVHPGAKRYYDEMGIE